MMINSRRDRSVEQASRVRAVAGARVCRGTERSIERFRCPGGSEDLRGQPPRRDRTGRRSLLHRALAAGEIESASGTARLLAPSSPFGVAVTTAGEHLYNVLFDLQGLPEPASLRAIHDVYRVGHDTAARSGRQARRSHNGTVTLGRVAFDRILILITAEASATSPNAPAVSCCAARRRASACSRTIWRSCSPVSSAQSARHDGAVRDPGQARHHAADEPRPAAWTPPPMHPQVSDAARS